LKQGLSLQNRLQGVSRDAPRSIVDRSASFGAWETLRREKERANFFGTTAAGDQSGLTRTQEE
jgi:hypothetical protein